MKLEAASEAVGAYREEVIDQGYDGNELGDLLRDTS
jgi:hypothetical protein